MAKIKMIPILKIRILGILFLYFSVLSCNDDSSKFQGIYIIKGGSLIINSNNTCFFLAENTCIKGIIKIDNNIVTIKSYVPKVPFVLYGRICNSYTHDKIMFQNFENVDGLINFDTGNNISQKMIPVLNDNANCVDYPLVFTNSNITKKFSFAIKGKSDVFEFENNEGYNDFIVQYIDSKTKNFEIVLNWDKNSNVLKLNGKPLEKQNTETFKKDTENLIGMYNRAFPETEYYYCNEAYNFFEENGIDVHTDQYEKVVNFDEYYYKDKYNDPPLLHETDDSYEYTENDKNEQYNDKCHINEYKKITPNVLKNKTFLVKKISIFVFNCNSEKVINEIETLNTN